MIIKRLNIIWKKILHGYYINNWFECRRNKGILKKSRGNSKNSSINKRPLISVRIATYNRGKILSERTIPSVLRQTYQNFEIIIVGDHCTDDTDELIKKFNDNRIKFYNLPKRGEYPTNPYDRWLVAGVEPMNKGVELSSGEWIAPLDDDDEFSDDHLEVLLNYALEHGCEMVYGKAQMEMGTKICENVGSYPLKCGQICHLAVLYQSKLKFIKLDINAWKYREPADWNIWRRMKEAGVKIGFVDKVVGKHYLEYTQRGI